MEQNQLGHQNCHKMKKFVFSLLLLFIVADCFAVPVEVVKIIDGDTFVGRVKLSDKTEVMSVKVRLRNVDTPELNGKCESEIKMARYAKQRLGELIPENTVVEIKNIKNDKYAGRIDANVFDSANRDVGDVLTKEKVGRPYSGGKRTGWCQQ